MYDLSKIKFFMQCSANTLHHNWPLMQAFNLRLEELSKGHGLTVCVTFFKKKGDESTWAIDEECYLTEGKYYEENPKELEKVFYAWLVARKNFYDLTEQIELKLSKEADELNLSRLLELYKKFNSAYVEEYATALISDYFVVYGDNIIKEISNKLTKEQAKNITVLTSPLKLPFLGEEQLSELKIGLKLIQNKEINEAKKAPKNYDKLHADIKEAILSHQKEFFWIRNNYKYTLPISCDQFLEDIKHEISNLSSTELTQKISELQNYEELLKKKKQQALAGMNLSKPDIIRLELISKVSWWADQRKKANLVANHYINIFLAKFAELLSAKFGKKIKLDQLQFTLLPELEALCSFESSKQEKENKGVKEIFGNIALRLKGCAYYLDKCGYEQIYIGKEFKNVCRKILEKNLETEVKDIRGTTASYGNVTGKVRVVFNPSNARFEKGEILVTSMTRPDFVPLMKKAAAVITDEGGITSHAAVICREFKLPCIVGTKIATKMLKDGMIVEINGNHCVVRILEK
ncbi:hypothetical protein HYU06_03440 [Candidatus Woesearchaeota archaeon]|nr:hypothetical protein [Candidatus Woesearchaeota archaeon]